MYAQPTTLRVSPLYFGVVGWGGQGGIGGEIGDLAEQVAREEARAAERAFPMLLGSQAQMQMARTSHTPPPLRGATGGSELCDGGAGSGPAGRMCGPGM